jgi:hypothetical protein
MRELLRGKGANVAEMMRMFGPDRLFAVSLRPKRDWARGSLPASCR